MRDGRAGAPMTEPLFVLERLQKRYGARSVLDIETLELQTGRSYALTGDNGAGKTTLLRVMAGLEPAEVAFGRYLGRPVDLGAAYPDWLRRNVIYVHQHPYLFRCSVKENIAYGLRARGMPRREREQLVREAVAWAGVGHLLGTPAQSLSAGEKQRVALARARVLKPRLFLLDEPTANLDAEARRQTMALIRDLCHADGTAVIACHDREVLQVAGIRRLHLEGGRIEHGAGAVESAQAARREDLRIARDTRRAVNDLRWRPAATD
jgi:tungstate transport system ATP-binding protein